MNILLPFDGKPHSQRAVDLAIKLFNLSSSTVTLLHVVDEPSSEMLMRDKTGRIEETYPEVAAQESQVLLEFLGKKFENAGAKVELRIQKGKAGAEIKALAETNKIQAIVTTPGSHSAKDLMLESNVTNQLLQVEYEVLLVLARDNKNGSSESQSTCAFLMDGSDQSIKCLQLLTPLVKGKMQILLVTSKLGWGAADSTSIFRFDNPAVKSTDERSAEEVFKAASAVLDEMGVQYEEVSFDEDFESCIGILQKGYNLGLLVATRSKDDVLHRPLKGAASERVFVSAPCSSALYCAAVN